MAIREEDEHARRLNEIYSEHLVGVRAQVSAMDRNVLRLIAERRDRDEQIDETHKATLKQLGVCAIELRDIKAWVRLSSFVGVSAIILLGIGVTALLIKVF